MNEKIREQVFEKNGRYYRQYTTYCEKLGTWTAQTPHRISKEEYEKAKKEEVKDNE